MKTSLHQNNIKLKQKKQKKMMIEQWDLGEDVIEKDDDLVEKQQEVVAGR